MWRTQAVNIQSACKLKPQSWFESRSNSQGISPKWMDFPSWHGVSSREVVSDVTAHVYILSVCMLNLSVCACICIQVQSHSWRPAFNLSFRLRLTPKSSHSTWKHPNQYESGGKTLLISTVFPKRPMHTPPHALHSDMRGMIDSNGRLLMSFLANKPGAGTTCCPTSCQYSEFNGIGNKIIYMNWDTVNVYILLSGFNE